MKRRGCSIPAWRARSLIGPALAAHVLLFLLLAAEKPAGLAPEPRASSPAPVEESAAQLAKHASLTADFAVAALLALRLGPAVAGRVFHDLSLHAPRSSSLLPET